MNPPAIITAAALLILVLGCHTCSHAIPPSGGDCAVGTECHADAEARRVERRLAAAKLAVGTWDDVLHFGAFSAMADSARPNPLGPWIPTVRIVLRLTRTVGARQKVPVRRARLWACAVVEASGENAPPIAAETVAVAAASRPGCRQFVTGSDGTAALIIAVAVAAKEEQTTSGGAAASSPSVGYRVVIKPAGSQSNDDALNENGSDSFEISLTSAVLNAFNNSGLPFDVSVPPSYSSVFDPQQQLAVDNPRIHHKLPAPVNRLLQLAFLIDTTGSMGVELNYVTTQLQHILRKVREAETDVDQEVALVFYRDEGDEYVVKTHTFTPNFNDTLQQLRAEQAHGGGDLPEAPDRAFQQALSMLQWNPLSHVVPVLFWIADAPHHSEKNDAMVDAIFAAASKGIRVYSVAAKNVDVLTKYTMRFASLVTGGRHMFVTNFSKTSDGGFQGLTCFKVVTLSHAIRSAVMAELDGGPMAEPGDPSHVLEHVGGEDCHH